MTTPIIINQMFKALRFTSPRSLHSMTHSQHLNIKAFVADWDDTITNDTIHLVAEAAYQTHPDFPYPWDHFKKVYMDNYHAYTSSFSPPRTTLQDERRYQEGMKDVEMSSVLEYQRLELFKGVTVQTLESQAAKVQVKPHAMETLRLIKSMNIPIRILSVNWTSVIMRKVLEMNGIEVDGDKVKIYTNEFETLDNGVLTGRVADGLNIRTGIDKERVLGRVRDELAEGPLWYIGDSSTDLFSLLSADVGVIIEGGSALQTVEKYDIPYNNGISSDGKEKPLKYIKSWGEILDAL